MNEIIEDDTVLGALKSAAGRQGSIYQEHGILLVITLSDTGVLLKMSWASVTGQTFDVIKKMSWLLLETSIYPKDALNVYVDNEIQSINAAKKKLFSKDRSAPSDTLAPHRCSTDVPVWERGPGTGCQ